MLLDVIAAAALKHTASVHVGVALAPLLAPVDVAPLLIPIPRPRALTLALTRFPRLAPLVGIAPMPTLTRLVPRALAPALRQIASVHEEVAVLIPTPTPGTLTPALMMLPEPSVGRAPRPTLTLVPRALAAAFKQRISVQVTVPVLTPTATPGRLTLALMMFPDPSVGRTPAPTFTALEIAAEIQIRSVQVVEGVVGVAVAGVEAGDVIVPVAPEDAPEDAPEEAPEDAPEDAPEVAPEVALIAVEPPGPTRVETAPVELANELRTEDNAEVAPGPAGLLANELNTDDSAAGTETVGSAARELRTDESAGPAEAEGSLAMELRADERPDGMDPAGPADTPAPALRLAPAEAATGLAKELRTEDSAGPAL